MNEREIVFFECDHMRPVVCDGETWRHIRNDGRLGSRCGSIGYRQIGMSSDRHTTGSAVPSNDALAHPDQNA